MTQRNEPAFPVEIDGEGEGKQTGPSSAMATGMTLRDYFAAKAMQGILAYPGDGTSGSAHNNSTPSEVALMAYEYADWMLAKREN